MELNIDCDWGKITLDIDFQELWFASSVFEQQQEYKKAYFRSLPTVENCGNVASIFSIILDIGEVIQPNKAEYLLIHRHFEELGKESYLSDLFLENYLILTKIKAF